MAAATTLLACAIIYFGTVVVQFVPVGEEAINQTEAALAESAYVRQSISDSLDRIDAAIKTSDDLIREMQQLRTETANEILKESAALRKEIPLYLDRAERMIASIDSAGKRASEGAVTGLATGILKTPGALLKNLGQVFSGIPKMTSEDKDVLAVEFAYILDQAVVGTTRDFYVPQTGRRGTITLRMATELDTQSLRVVELQSGLPGSKSQQLELTISRNHGEDWKLDSRKEIR